jgi:hypothetical protein
VAAFLQARIQRVPNSLTLISLGTAWLCGLALSVSGAAAGGLASGLAGAFIGGLLLLPFWAIGGLGAGCVKAQMSFGAWIGCALGTSATALTVAVSTLAGIATALALYGAVARLYPAVDYDLETWQMNAQSLLSLGSVAGLIGCLWFGAI